MATAPTGFDGNINALGNMIDFFKMDRQFDLSRTYTITIDPNDRNKSKNIVNARINFEGIGSAAHVRTVLENLCQKQTPKLVLSEFQFQYLLKGFRGKRDAYFIDGYDLDRSEVPLSSDTFVGFRLLRTVFPETKPKKKAAPKSSKNKFDARISDTNDIKTEIVSSIKAVGGAELVETTKVAQWIDKMTYLAINLPEKYTMKYIMQCFKNVFNIPTFNKYSSYQPSYTDHSNKNDTCFKNTELPCTRDATNNNNAGNILQMLLNKGIITPDVIQAQLKTPTTTEKGTSESDESKNEELNINVGDINSFGYGNHKKHIGTERLYNTNAYHPYTPTNNAKQNDPKQSVVRIGNKNIKAADIIDNDLLNTLNKNNDV
mmetsp:Transcript_18808/g.23126  ORF Transcript_18808/g.23126 Transcript_18808/m.23126 type:complete len:374 (+) Transcript_18808:22-1143(+)